MKTLAKWSVDDYHRMIEAGILHDRRVELLAGEIVEMSPETPIHYNTAKRGAKYLEELLAGKADVRFNGPITLPDSEPEPDIAIVRLPESAYNDRHPGRDDICWVVEVAKTSLKKDLDLKTSIYASAEIQEYWILDLSARRMIVLREPQNGQYAKQQVIREGVIPFGIASLHAPLAFPDIQVSVERLLA
ncbi:Uma2 family endonuclease [Microcoleus sp. FACHB-53]|nr:Uma2 family endonuclease [Microcoleus sp. FACHB-53]